MLHATSKRVLLIAAVMIAEAVTACSARALPIDGGVEGPTPDVFYNFYVPPVPAGVGHTWITYPPFMPHEFLYKHRRRYIRPAGVTGMRTDVKAYWY